MNIKAKNIITVSIMKCNIIPFTAFRKRVLVFLMAIVLCFNTICKPDETKATEVAVGAILTTAVITGIVTNVLGCVIPDGWEAIKRAFRKDNPDATDQEIEDYFRNNITVNGDGNYVLTDGAIATLSNMKKHISDEVDCVIGYTWSAEMLDPMCFQNKLQYDVMKEWLCDNPDWCLIPVFEAGTGMCYAIKKDDLCGLVCNTLDGALVGQAINQNWDNIMRYLLYFGTDGTVSYIVQFPWKRDGWSVTEQVRVQLNGSLDEAIAKCAENDHPTLEGYGEVDFSYVDGVRNHMGFARTDFPYSVKVASSLVRDYENKTNCVYNAECIAVECYKTLNALKRGTYYAKMGAFTPQYSKDVPSVVTPDDIKNNNKNTKPFNNTNNDDDGGGSSGNNNNNNNNDDSGSGGFWDTLGDGVLGLFKGIGKLLGRAIEGILELFNQLLDAISDIISYLDDDIAKFFKDVLSFMPEPWVKTITLGLTLVIIGFVITLLRGGK